MGISPKLNRYENDVLSHFGLKYEGLNLCELGAQKYWSAGKGAKLVYQARGVNHTSIDLNGRYASLRLNLDNPLPAEMHGKFDVVTNYGTIEHVNNQYGVFKNVHDICKVGGLMIHGFPKKDNWVPHGRYYYTHEFVYELANLCGYEIYNLVDIDFASPRFPKRLLVTVTFRKTEGEFPILEQFSKLPIFDSGDLTATGNYTHGKRRRHNSAQ